MVETAVAEGLALVRAGVNALLSADLTGLPALAVAESMELLEVQRCRVQPTEARRRVARARMIMPRVAVSGGGLPPPLPHTAEAAAAGEFGGAQTDVVARTMEAIDHLPCAVEAAPVAERFLVESARREHARVLQQTANLLLARLDPDGLEPAEAARERGRAVTLAAGCPGRLLGLLTAECEATWQAVLDPLAAPLPGEDGTPDQRTPDLRRHDAFLEAGRMLLRSGQLPDTVGTPTTLLIRTALDELADEHGAAQDGQDGQGTLMSTPAVRRLLDEAEVGIVLQTGTGRVLSYGRDCRLASPSQRRALGTRDGECCFPDCTRPPAWTQAHHVVAWMDGGTTDLDNLASSQSDPRRLVMSRGTAAS